MKNKLLLFLPLFIVAANVSNSVKAQVKASDSLALVDLYNNTGGPDWTFDNGWLTSAPVSSWYGVGISGGRVTALLLGFNNMKGQLLSSIGDLTAMTFFELSFNKLTGPIPASFANLQQLQEVNLNNNRFTGNLPPITGLANLEQLALDHNQLTGSIPVAIDSLTRLTYLNLSFNKMSGSIPPAIGNTQLTELYLNRNQLTGTIPASIGKLTGMLVLDLSYNELSGIIPPALSNLTELFDLYLNNNRLTGEVPPALISQLEFVFAIDLSHNQLSQPENIPVMGARNFIDLDLRYNSFTFNGLEYAAVKLPNAEYIHQGQLPVHTYKNQLSVSAGGTLSNNTYRWFLAGIPVPVNVNKGDSTFRPAISGRYYATVNNSLARPLTLTTDTITYAVPHSKEDAPIALVVYPNPAKGLLTVSGLNPNHQYTMMIADVNGHVWLQKGVNNQSATSFNVSILKAGNYLLNVKDGAEKKAIQFVKE